MVEQFGLAMIPQLVYPAIACGFTSGTTRGMSSSRRKCDVLSITTQPAAAAIGAYSSEILPPAENRPICALLKSNSAKSVTVILFPRNRMLLPADRALAKGYKVPTGKLRCSKISIMASPTAPVAPTIATSNVRLMSSILTVQSVEKGLRVPLPPFREWIGNTLTCDIGCRAMTGLVHAATGLVERSRGQHTDRTREHRRCIG